MGSQVCEWRRGASPTPCVLGHRVPWVEGAAETLAPPFCTGELGVLFWTALPQALGPVEWPATLQSPGRSQRRAQGREPCTGSLGSSPALPLLVQEPRQVAQTLGTSKSSPGRRGFEAS